MVNNVFSGRLDGGQITWIRDFHETQVRYRIQLHVERKSNKPYGCISSFSLLKSAPKWYFEELLFSILKKHIVYKIKTSKKNWIDQIGYLVSVLSYDYLFVEPFYESMELWHV
jgi:hypothetical protein